MSTAQISDEAFRKAEERCMEVLGKLRLTEGGQDNHESASPDATTPNRT